jgi:hypothetical protein
LDFNKISINFYPSGKFGRPHLLCCPGLAVYLYGFALDASDLQPPKLLQHRGEYECRVVRLTDDIALDFVSGEKLVGIEVLEVSRLFKETGGPVIEIKDLLPQVIAA